MATASSHWPARSTWNCRSVRGKSGAAIVPTVKSGAPTEWPWPRVSGGRRNFWADAGWGGQPGGPAPQNRRRLRRLESLAQNRSVAATGHLRVGALGHIELRILAAVHVVVDPLAVRAESRMRMVLSPGGGAFRSLEPRDHGPGAAPDVADSHAPFALGAAEGT